MLLTFINLCYLRILRSDTFATIQVADNKIYPVAVIVTTNPPIMSSIISIDAVNPLNLSHMTECPGLTLHLAENCSKLWKT